MYFYKCPHCGNFFELSNGSHMIDCFPNVLLEDETILYCFSCGKQDQQYTQSQINKFPKSRCVSCVSNNICQKFERYLSFYQPLDDSLDKVSLEKQLMYSIEKLNIQMVGSLLNLGANPNYIRQLIINDGGCLVYAYDKDGNEIPESDNDHPSTPLKMCVFRMSGGLDVDEQQTLVSIAQLLITRGARKQGVRDYFVSRYDISNRSETDPFRRLWELII